MIDDTPSYDSNYGSSDDTSYDFDSNYGGSSDTKPQKRKTTTSQFSFPKPPEYPTRKPSTCQGADLINKLPYPDKVRPVIIPEPIPLPKPTNYTIPLIIIAIIIILSCAIIK